MILCDAGPLVALVDRDDARHADCLGALAGLATPLLTTWPCLTEAMYLIERRYGFHGQNAIWSLLERNIVTLHTHQTGEWQRMRKLMGKYENVPMDLADASLVVAAETLSLKRIFTLDADFQIYRLNDTDAFEIIP